MQNKKWHRSGHLLIDPSFVFNLSTEKIDPHHLARQLNDASCGASVTFEGWVRNHHQGKAVIALEYEAMAVLCQSEAEKILEEARQRFHFTHALCVHRMGRLLVGDIAVWVGVTAAHRDAAFKACRYIIDEVKDRLPIWKKEFFSDGQSMWVNCGTSELQQVLREHDVQSGGAKGVLFPHGAEGEYGKSPKRQDPVTKFHPYYARQMILPEIGNQGQEKLHQAKVLVVGAGGLGCPALTSLAQAGIGQLGICEDDVLDVSNLHRQSLYDYTQLGEKKSDLALQRLKALNPFIDIQIFPTRLTADNIKSIIGDYPYLVDATDNFKTKYLLNDAAVLYHKVLVQAGIYQFEGQVRVYDPHNKGACLRCLWPTPPDSGCIGSCTQAGVVGIIPNVLGHLQAWEVIKHILQMPDRLQKQTLLFDFKTLTLSKIHERSNPACPLCGNHPTITEPLSENVMMSTNESSPTISVASLKSNEFKNYIFIDVREESELMMNPVDRVKAIHLPFSEFGNWNFDFEKDKHYLIFCAHGMRSLACVERLRKQGIKNVQSVNQGAEAIQFYGQNG